MCATLIFIRDGIVTIEEIIWSAAKNKTFTIQTYSEAEQQILSLISLGRDANPFSS